MQRQWAYTFDSIGDPIFVHDREGRMLRINQRMLHLAGRENKSWVGRSVLELFPQKNAEYEQCPYCEGVAGEGDDPDPWLPGYFLASNSVFADPAGRQMGTVHVLKDISDRKRFLETLEEACQKTGWVIHAYMLMGNHYHLLAETPEGNLVAGMKRLQSAWQWATTLG